MSELRRRAAPGEAEQERASDRETAEEKNTEADVDSAFEGDVADVPADLPTDSTPQMLNNALSGMSSRWKNWWIRGIFSLTMITSFFFPHLLGTCHADTFGVGDPGEMFP